MILQVSYTNIIVILVEIYTIIFKMQPGDKEPKRGLIHSFFRLSFKKKKVNSSTSSSTAASTMDISSQITESDEISCCSTDKPLESPPPSSSTIPSPSSSTIPSPPLFSQPSPSSLTLRSLSCPTSPSSTMRATTEIFTIPSDISRSAQDPPAQPKLMSYKQNKDNRSFRSIWYLKYPWLEYSIEQDCAFCYYCRHFNDTSNLLNRVCKI
jgi:hypothetical protein